MSTGIKPKVVTRGKQHNEHARRYIFYPLSNLDFAGSQFMSPIWQPKISKGKITLLESFEYQTPVSGEGEEMAGGNGVALGERTMGTDAQVRFLMGNSEGSGWMDKGMTNLDSMVDADYETAAEVEALLGLSESVPVDLIAFKEHLNSISFEGDSPVITLAAAALAEMKAGVDRAINFCRTTSSQLEQELNDGRNGGVGIKFLSETQKYYFHQIRVPLPEDRVGTNMGAELSKVLAPLLQGQGTTTNSIESSVELTETKNKLAAAEAALKEKNELVEALLEEKNDTTEPATA